MPVSLPLHQWDLLLRCPLFQACPEALVRDVLARSGCSVEEFSSGAEIYRPDRFRRCLGLLLSGRVLVTKGSLTVSTLEPGDLFGAAALYNDAPDYATTLTAQGICRCLLLDQELLDRLLGEEALLRRNYLTYLTGRIRFLNARLGSLAVGDTEGRVVRYLLSRLSYGAVECSASGLARQLGISRASVYRAFQDLEQAGLIRREGRPSSSPIRPLWRVSGAPGKKISPSVYKSSQRSVSAQNRCIHPNLRKEACHETNQASAPAPVRPAPPLCLGLPSRRGTLPVWRRQLLRQLQHLLFRHPRPKR